MQSRFIGAAVAAALSGASGAWPAHAHVTLNPNEGQADAYFRTALRVSHGCGGAPTVAVKVTMPDGVISVKPQAKTGWTVAVTRRPLKTPVDNPHRHDHKIVDQVDTVEWRGGPLVDSQFDEFGLLMKLPATAGTLWFPVHQECTGAVFDWVNIPAAGQSWHDTKTPAPFVRVRAGGAK